MADDRPALIVAGPTGSGKSALSLALARAFTGTIINADSMQIYAELRVLTARPSAEEELQAPHRLYGVVPVRERWSVGRWLEAARQEIEAAWQAGRLPIVTGGTGLYLRALGKGLSPVPQVPAALCRDLEAAYDREGGALFRERLRSYDPQAAARLPSGDRQRLIRAMAVALGTGQALTAWHALHPPQPALDARFATLVLLPPRERLYRRLDARFMAMLANGAVAEVQDLMNLNLDAGLPAMKALGVPELVRFLNGETTLAEASAQAQAVTRRYAKRQVTWLRHQTTADLVIEDDACGQLCARSAAFMRAFLLTHGP
ncbi:MAG: tRNA (adenosine(37)-N6)-dimethylallyltransferase MiaA [Defluviicoccus sp.]